MLFYPLSLWEKGSRRFLPPLPLGEGWGEGYNSLSLQSINSNINNGVPFTDPLLI
ncbi:hypothetical protein MNBD_GAMMA08-2551 [hydrothermal vent metagenome]|uniref:Uncharacterized protein n=1 Tax=hydrothermal vent metagenome TaxID=652676 RepID=A0A3B0X6L3_9ZZZZ